MTPTLTFLFGLALGAALIALLPYRWGNRLLFAVLMSIVACAFLGRAVAGAPIPPKPGGYYPPPAARNDCLETYRADKSFRCDRLLLSQFEVAK